MDTVRQVARVIWWLMLASAPLILWHVIDQLLREIGCPPQGDCYKPGWPAAFNLDLSVFGLAILVWPACTWNLGLRWLAYRLFGLEPPNNSFKPKPIRGSA